MFARHVNTKLDLLRRISLFRECTTRELEDICTLTDEVRVDAGEVLTREGASGQECYVVSDGVAAISLRGREIAEARPGDVIGEMALVDVDLRAATVTAKTEMSLLVLEPRSFSALLERHPRVTRAILTAMARRLRAATTSPFV
jgi:CRP-like cAMP-binding protein